MNPYGTPPKMHAFKYQPHGNCARLAEFLGEDDLCDGEGDSDHNYTTGWGETVEPGQWVVKDGKSFYVCDTDELFEAIVGMSGVQLET